MNVLVTGGRYYNLQSSVFSALNSIHQEEQLIDRIIVGCAGGADKLARQWAAEWGVKCSIYKADWNNLGKRAGPIRNQKMVDTKPDIVVAFPGGKGTADCVRRAEEAGIEVRQEG